VGGYRWKVNSRERFTRHYNFAKQNGLRAVIERARGGKSFWMDPEGGPWAGEIARSQEFGERFASQNLDRYLGIVFTTGQSLFDRDTAPGAEPEEVMGVDLPTLTGRALSTRTAAKSRFLECHAAGTDDSESLQSTSGVLPRTRLIKRRKLAIPGVDREKKI
jgi:hypothetical protein